MDEPRTDARLPRVLLVEDNPLHVRLVQTMLREVWSDISSLRTAKQLDVALVHLEDSTPDLILLDLVLPDADHLDGLNALLEFAPAVPIVVLSAYEDEALAVQALAAGAEDYLVKGRIGSETLARSIRFAMIRSGVARPRLPAPPSAGRTGRAIVGLDGRVHRVDPGLVAITGFEAAELVGGHIMGLTTPEDSSRWTDHLSAMESTTPTHSIGVSLRTRRGGARFVTAELTPLLGSKGSHEVVVRFATLTADLDPISEPTDATTPVSA